MSEVHEKESESVASEPVITDKGSKSDITQPGELADTEESTTHEAVSTPKVVEHRKSSVKSGPEGHLTPKESKEHESLKEPKEHQTPTEPKEKKTKGEKDKKGKKDKKKKVKIDEVKVEESAEAEATSISSLTTVDVENEFKRFFQRRKMFLQESSATPTVKLSPQSISEESASSKEDSKKEKSQESLDGDFDFEQNHNFCITALEGHPDIPGELSVVLQTLLQKYKHALEKNKKAKEKADADLTSTTEKMHKDLLASYEMKKELKELKTKFETSETTIADLKKQLDESYAREHDLIDDCKLALKKVEYLNSELESRQAEDQLREEGLEITAKSRESFTKEITRLKQDLELSDNRLQLSLQDLEDLQKKYQEKEGECVEMEEMLKGNKYSVLKEIQKSKVLQADLERVTGEMRNLKLTVAKHYKTFKNASQELVKMDEEVFELRKINREQTHENEAFAKLTKELKERLEFGEKKYSNLDEEHKRLKSICKNQTGTVDVIKKKSSGIDKIRDVWLNRIISADKRKHKAIQDAQYLYHQMKDMAHEEKKTRLTIIKLNRTISNMKRENMVISKQLKNMQNLVEQQQKHADERNQTIQQMTEESNKLKVERDTQEKALTKFFRMKEKDMKEKMILEQNFEKMKEDLSISSFDNVRLHKELDEKMAEVKQMKNLLHSVTTEKKYLYKRLLESQGQITDLQSKSKYIFQEMELVKDQLHKKQLDYEKLQTSNRKDVFTKDTMIFKLDSCNDNRKSLLKTIEEKDMEIKQQIDVIIKRDDHIKEMQLELETLKRQSGDLKTVIQKRNAELSLVYEKTNLMTYILNNGEEQYQQRLKDIELLKKEVRKLRTDKKLLTSLAENTPNLRLEMFHLHKDLSKERQKCRALEEQMENPLNIHRWRLLEGKDPEKKDLIEKNQILQKKLLRVEQDNGIIREQCASMEMLYHNMRTYLNSLPGRDAVQYLETARHNLRDKTRENKVLSAKLAAYQNELALLRRQMEEIKRESNEIKEKYYEMKKKYDQQAITSNRLKSVQQSLRNNPTGDQRTSLSKRHGLLYVQSPRNIIK
ncbi:cilia- and flagella-associated protein 58 [Halyomorpha halys]|uniref:cilia- and flagella-associated protein 58 n=1 Tax=Halyomorpha halys TaxID=286706 RepID=UPI0006D4D8A8